MKLTSVVLLVGFCYLVSSRASVIKLSPHAAAHFQRLMVTYKELFTSQEEKQERLQNFIAASQVIDAHNDGPNGRYFQLEHNKMSLLSTEEKMAMRGRIAPLAEDRQQRTTTTKKPTTTTTRTTTTKTTTTKKPTTTKTTTTKKPTTTTTRTTTTKTTTTKKPTTTTTRQPRSVRTKKPTTTTTRRPSTSTTSRTTTASNNTISTTISASTTTTISTTTSSPVVNGLDLRTSTVCGKQIPVKDQLGCGSCWAFSAIAPIEWAQCNKTGTYTRLSDEELVSCDTYNGGCNGGDPIVSMGWIMNTQSGAVATELSYPYTSGNGITGTCKLGSPGIVTGATMASYTQVPCTENNGAYASVANIENAIRNYGVVAVCVYVGSSGLFDFYGGGVFVDPICPTIISGKCQYTNTNHCGSLVGWGVDSTSTLPYWIFRNQWGPKWGMAGYMFIQKGVNMCGIESEIAYVNVTVV